MKNLITSLSNLSLNHREYSSLPDEDAKIRYARLNHQLKINSIPIDLLEIKISMPAAKKDLTFDLYFFEFMGKSFVRVPVYIEEGENSAVMSSANYDFLREPARTVRYIGLFPTNADVSGVWIEVLAGEPAVFFPE